MSGDVSIHSFQPFHESITSRSGGKPVGQLRHFSVISMDIFEAKLVGVLGCPAGT